MASVHANSYRVLELLLAAMGQPRSKFELGHTFVFFRAGELARVDALIQNSDEKFIENVATEVMEWLESDKIKKLKQQGGFALGK